jgi:tripartite-type tricarboxylate transporter receptor subunit TctC
VDSLARILVEHMRVTLGQTIIVENMAGAGGTLAMTRIVRAPPDGYTIGMGTLSQYVISAAVYEVPFNVLTDLEPVVLLPSVPYWMIGKKTLPPNTLQELIAHLKENPNQLSASSTGTASLSRFCGMAFQEKTGTSFQFVPYRGGAPALQDVVGGQIDLSCLEASQTLAAYRAGKIKVFGVAAAKRWPGAPEVPTLAEAGVPGVDIAFWHGLWAPKGTPKPILDKLNAAVVEAFADPVVQKRFTDIGHVLPAREQQNPQALFAHHKAEIDKWWPIIKAAGIKPTN